MEEDHAQLKDVKPIITVKEARKLLGKTAKNLTDIQVLDTINILDRIAKLLADNKIYDTINGGSL